MSIFNFKSIGHYIATGIETVKVWLTVHHTEIEKDLQIGAGVIALVNPAAGALASVVSRAGSALLGDAMAVANAADSVVAEKGVNLVLDAAMIASLKQLYADLVKVSPTLATAPAGLPVTAPHA